MQGLTCLPPSFVVLQLTILSIASGSSWFYLLGQNFPKGICDLSHTCWYFSKVNYSFYSFISSCFPVGSGYKFYFLNYFLTVVDMQCYNNFRYIYDLAT